MVEDFGVGQTAAPTRQDVARLAGVSTAVVSYVVNDGPRPVAAETRQRVLTAVRELNYRPNATARALRMGKMNAIGLIVPDISNPYFSELGHEVTSLASDESHAVLLGDANNDAERELQQLRSLIARQVDGILLVSLRPVRELTESVTNGTPVVVLDEVRRSDPHRSVAMDNRGGTLMALEHLQEHGHTRIGFIGGPAGMPGADSRKAAWARSLGRRGKDKSIVADVPFTREGGYSAVRRLMQADDPPTAVFVSSDVQAIGFLSGCHERGISVPDDVAVVSFDGTQESEFACPRLTTVKQPIEEMAQTALRSLRDPNGPRHATIAPRLIVRRSCGCGI